MVFQSGIPEIDTVLASMTDENCATRPAAYDVLRDLMYAIAEIPPKMLKTEPILLGQEHDRDAASGEKSENSTAQCPGESTAANDQSSGPAIVEDTSA